MKRSIRYTVVLSVIAGMVMHVGCASMTTPTSKDKDKKKDSRWSLFKKKEYQQPASMNVTWMHDVLTKPGKPATRGFGGRIFFYNEKSQAIPVDGELTVYGFDDTLRSHDGVALESADKRFRFTPEQFTGHFSESQLGASYSVWIPWDALPGDQKKIMLIPTFMSKDGRILRGNAATVNLPGRIHENAPPEPDQYLVQASANMPVKSAPIGSFNAHGNSTSYPNRVPGTTTIQLPPKSVRSNVPSSEQLSLAIEQANQLASDAQRLNTSNLGLNQTPLTGLTNGLPQSGNPMLPAGPTSPQSWPANIPQEHPNHYGVPIGQGFPPPNSPASAQLPPLSNQAVFTPPSGMPVSKSVSGSKNVNGWAMPEFSQAQWTGLSAHSAQYPPQAPNASNVQPAAYPPR